MYLAHCYYSKAITQVQCIHKEEKRNMNERHYVPLPRQHEESNEGVSVRMSRQDDGPSRGHHMASSTSSHSALPFQQQDLSASLNGEMDPCKVQSQDIDTCLHCWNLKLESGPRRRVDVARLDGLEDGLRFYSYLTILCSKIIMVFTLP